MNLRSKILPLVGFASVLSTLVSPAADLLSQWNFTNGSASPSFVGPGMGGGLLTPTGTATFGGAGITGTPGDNALSLTNTYNVAPGSAAATTLPNLLTNAGNLDSFTVTMWVNLASSSYTADQFPRLFQIGPAQSPDNVIPSVSVTMSSGSVEVGVNQSNGGRIGGPVAGNVPANFNSSQAGTWVFLAVSYDGLQTNPYFSADSGNFLRYAVRNNLVVLAGTASESVTVSGSSGVNTGNRSGNFNQSPGPIPLGTADYVYLGNRQNGQRGLNGSLDDVRLYRGQLTIPELNAVRLEGAPPPPNPVPAFFWKGNTSSDWTASNWTSDLGGSTPTTPPPTNGTQTVAFSATGATNLSTILGTNQSLLALQFNSQSGGATLGGTHDLTLGSFGIISDANSGPDTINTTGQVSLGADQLWINNSVNPFTVSSTISGAFKLSTGGTGTTFLSGSNTHTGGTRVSGGILKMGNALALGPVTTSVTAESGTLDLNGFSPTIGNLAGASSISNTGSDATLTLNNTAAAVFTGTITGGGPGQAIAFVKNGAGSLSFGGLSSYTGNVSINSGIVTAATASTNTAVTTSLGAGQSGGRIVTIAPAAILRFTANNIFGAAAANPLLLPEIVIGSDAVSPGMLEATRYNSLGKVTLNGGVLSHSSTDNGTYQGYQFRSDVLVSGDRPSLISSGNGKANHLATETAFNVENVTGDLAVDLSISAPLWNQSGDFVSGAGSLVKLGDGTMELIPSL